MKALVILFLLFTYSISAQAQENFGEIDLKYFEMTHCPIDSSAGAFIIFNKGMTQLDFAGKIEFFYHGRIKILNSSEFDRANIKINYFDNDNITNFKASTYNLENGKIIESEISKKDASIIREDDDIKSFNFSFSNVKEGSIIEYEYAVNYGSIRRLNTWYFQSNIPALESKYEVILPSFLIYKRVLTGRPLQKADLSYEFKAYGSSSTNHQIHDYVAYNVPAFKDEPYLTAENDYISKISFELSSTDFPDDFERNYMHNNYMHMARDLYNKENYHKKISNSRFTKEMVDVVKNTSESELDVIKTLFYYVRDNLDEDNEYNNYTLKRVLSEKKGTSSQINMILGAALLEAGYDANLVLLSTRSNGKLHPTLPMIKQFNHMIIKVNLDDEEYLMDASDKNIPFNVLPEYCLNGKGLVISQNGEWVELNPFKSNGTTYGGEFEVSDEGIISGKITIRRLGYQTWEFNDNLNDQGVDNYKETFNEKKDTWEIIDHEISDIVENYQIDENLEVEIEDKVDDLGDILYLSPIMIAQQMDNPFKTEKREYPVSFGAPFTITHLYKFKIDDSLIIDELPQAKSVALPNKGGRLLYSANQSDNLITITYRLQIAKDEFSEAEYPYLREFYSQLVAKHNEQIVLKRK